MGRRRRPKRRWVGSRESAFDRAVLLVYSYQGEVMKVDARCHYRSEAQVEARYQIHVKQLREEAVAQWYPPQTLLERLQSWMFEGTEECTK